MKQVMERAGAGVPSANRITLLRDADGDGVAETRTAFLEGLMSPFGMALVGNDLYVANADAIVRFPYQPGETRITAAGQPRSSTCPAARSTTTGPRTSSPAATAAGSTRRSARTATSARTAWRTRKAAPRSGRSTRRPAASGCSRPACATRTAWPGSRETNALVHGRQRARRARQRPRPRLPDFGARRRASTAGRTATTASTSTSGRSRRAPTWSPPRSRPTTRSAPTSPRSASRTREGAALPAPFQRGMFVGLHGSWNRKPLNGYKVVFVPFAGGKPSGAADRRADRLPQRRGQGAGPAGRRRDRQARRAARRRRRRQHRLAGVGRGERRERRRAVTLRRAEASGSSPRADATVAPRAPTCRRAKADPGSARPASSR